MQLLEDRNAPTIQRWYCSTCSLRYGTRQQRSDDSTRLAFCFIYTDEKSAVCWHPILLRGCSFVLSHQCHINAQSADACMCGACVDFENSLAQYAAAVEMFCTRFEILSACEEEIDVYMCVCELRRSHVHLEIDRASLPFKQCRGEH